MKYKEINKLVDNLTYWFIMALGVLAIFFELGMMVFICWRINPVAEIFPILLIVILRNTLWRYIKGFATLNSDYFPRFTL
jgi:hypothetical protein